MTRVSHLWPGVPLALGSAVLFGASAPLSNCLSARSIPGCLRAILYLGAGIGLAIVHRGRSLVGLPSPEASLQRTDWPWLAAVIVFGGMLGPLFLMLGLSQTAASSGSLLLNLESLATMAIAWLVFRENVDRKLILGAAAILAGAILLSWTGDGMRLDTGSMLIAAACLSWGIDNNLTRKLSSADPVQIAMIKGLVAGTTNLVLALTLGAVMPAAPIVAAGALVGLFRRGHQPRDVHARPAPPRHGPHRRLFFLGALYRGTSRHRAVPRAANRATRRRRPAHGHRALSASRGTP
jgi:drug/metabolite transporter (DMT)-like permease